MYSTASAENHRTGLKFMENKFHQNNQLMLNECILCSVRINAVLREFILNYKIYNERDEIINWFSLLNM